MTGSEQHVLALREQPWRGRRRIKSPDHEQTDDVQTRIRAAVIMGINGAHQKNESPRITPISTRRNTATRAAALLPLALAACASTSHYPSLPENPTLEQRIEREIAKFEQCILDAINSGKLKFATSSDQEREELKRIGLLGAHGSYNPKTNTLTLHRSSDERVTTESVGVLAHEITHWIFDEDPEAGKGLFYQEGFQGPTWEEVSAYCQKKVQEPQFAGILAHIDFGKEMEQTALMINDMIGSQLQMLGKVRDILNTLNENIKSDESLLKDLGKKEEKNISNTIKSLREEFLKAAEMVKTLSGVLKAFEEKGPSNSLANILELRNIIMAFYKSMTPFQGLHEKAKRVREYYAKVIDEADEKRTSGSIKSLEEKLEKIKRETDEEKDGKKKTVLEKKHSLLKDHLDMLRTYTLKNPRQQSLRMNEMIENLGNLSGDLQKSFNIVVSSMNTSALEKILGDPHEIIARIVDSLYKIQLDTVEQNQFPLNEGDLQFLSRFTFQGKMIFKNAIEKYRLALTIRKAGFTPREIREKLEYASRFEDHQWPGKPYKFNKPIEKQVRPNVPQPVEKK